MSRLTKRFEDNSGYTPVVNHPVRKEITLYDFEELDYACCVDKLGKIEDIMSKYKIKSVEELIVILDSHKKQQEKIIDLSADLGMYQNENTSLTKNIEKYWQIEQQLGCPLEVALKKIQELMVEYWDEVHCLQYNDDEKLWYIISYSLWGDEFYQSRLYNLKNYQITWWLKGEKENE